MHTPTFAIARCDDPVPSKARTIRAFLHARRHRLPQWLRLAVSDILTAFSWRWLVYAWASIRRLDFHVGTSTVLLPSRTGGADHGARAVLTGRNPMVFGGQASDGAFCLSEVRDSVVVRKVFAEVRTRSGATHLVDDGSWIATRRDVEFFPLEWPADCSAREAGAW